MGRSSCVRHRVQQRRQALQAGSLWRKCSVVVDSFAAMPAFADLNQHGHEDVFADLLHGVHAEGFGHSLVRPRLVEVQECDEQIALQGRIVSHLRTAMLRVRRIGGPRRRTATPTPGPAPGSTACSWPPASSTMLSIHATAWLIVMPASTCALSQRMTAKSRSE